jgi:zinc/manganese transport system substrate-binding protein
MKRIIIFLLSYILNLLFIDTAFSAKLNVATTYSYLASIVAQIGGDQVNITAFARGDYDPHSIIPKPSYIASLRKAQLLIINGAQLEIGWLPPLIKQANNPTLMPGKAGFLDLSNFVTLIDVPQSISRESGDVHPDGNPHYYLDPYNIPPIARAIATKLSEIDPTNSSRYANNLDQFLTQWDEKLKTWEMQLVRLKGMKVIEYHKLYDYFLRRYELNRAGTIEPIPGIPPTSKHIAELGKQIEQQKIDFIFQDVYHSKDASEHLAKRSGVKLIIMPHDVNAVKEANSIFTLFDEIVRRLTQ